MKTIEINIYKFDELSDEAKERAIMEWIDAEQKHGDPLMFFDEYCKEEAFKYGFRDCNFQWSFSWSQGDGLSFSGSFDINALTELFLDYLGTGKEKTAKLLAENCTVILKGNTGRYCFASESDVDLYIENYTSSINTDLKNIDIIVDKVLRGLENTYLNLCSKLEKDGYSWLDYHYSEENARESILANDYDFTEDGEIY